MSRFIPLTAHRFTASVSDEELAYAVEFCDAKGDAQTVKVNPEMVEAAVFKKADLDIVLRADGTVTLDAMGLSEPVIASIKAQGLLQDSDLVSLCRTCLNPKMLQLEDDPQTSLARLRQQLEACLALVDATLKKPGLVPSS